MLNARANETGGSNITSDFQLQHAPVAKASSAVPRSRSLHQDILVVSPPLVGGSTVCKNLSKTLGLPIRKIDELLDEVAKTKSVQGAKARLVLNKMTEKERSERTALLAQLASAAEASKALVEEEFKKANKKAKEVPPEVLLTPEVLKYEAYVEENRVSDALVAEIIRFRSFWVDAGHGIIIDGFTSHFLDESIVINSVRLALPSVVVVLLKVAGDGEHAYSAFVSNLHRVKETERDRLEKSLRKAKQQIVIENKKKRAILERRKKKTSGTTAAAVMMDQDLPIELDLIDFPYSIPEGDEPWIDPHTGLVIELESQDVRALEDAQKRHYNAQLQYQQKLQLLHCKDVLWKINRIWSMDTGLRLELLPELIEPTVIVEKKEKENDRADAIAEAEVETKAELSEFVENKQVENKQVQNEQDSAADVLQEYDSRVLAEEKAALVAAEQSMTLPTKVDKAILYRSYADSVLPAILSAFGPRGGEDDSSSSSARGENAITRPEGGAAALVTGGSVAPSSSTPISSPRSPRTGTRIAAGTGGIFEISVEPTHTEDIVVQVITLYSPTNHTVLPY